MRNFSTRSMWALVLSALLLQGIFVAPALAQATRTWVSGVGDDANPCSRTAPCKTLAGAIAKTVAGGEIDALDPAGLGALTITKAITIDGGGGQVASTLVSGTNGIVVAAGANDVVTLRNLRLNGLGTGLTGVLFNSGAALHLESVNIFQFTSYAVAFEPTTTPTGTQLGAGLFLKDVIVSNNAGGVLVRPSGVSAVATLDNVRMDQNTFGLWVADNAVASVHRSQATGNSSAGFVAQNFSGGSAVLNLDASMAAENSGSGIVAANQGSVVSLSNVEIVHNLMGIQARNGGTAYSFGNNRIFLNGSPGSAPTVVAQQ